MTEPTDTFGALTPVLPDPAIATGTGVLVIPGGAYIMLAIGHEGFDVAEWLADRGVAAFVLKYRVMETADSDDDRMQALVGAAEVGGLTGILSRMDEFASIPLADGGAALQLVRDRAEEWGVRPERIGALGFSAGARLVLDLATQEEGAVRPAFAGAIYGPGSERPVPADAPPLFAAVDALAPGSFPFQRVFRRLAMLVALLVLIGGLRRAGSGSVEGDGQVVDSCE